VRLCTPNGALHLDPGQHRLSSPGSPGPLAITDLTMANQTTSTASAPRRDVRVLDWQPESRSVAVGPGASTYLEVHETFSPGWTASLNGRELKSVRLDGWQQGYVVPAGAGGVVSLSFTPGTTYRQALAGSAGGVLLLVVGAVVPARTVRYRPGRSRTGRRTAAGAWVALAAVTVLFVVIGGIAAVLVPIIAALGYLRPRWIPVIAAGAMVAAGGCTVIGVVRHGVAAGDGAFGAPAQVFALAALAAALTPLLRRDPNQDTESSAT
jgi:arabinofuranan 3-O-arabinosyltransferase